MNFILSSSKDLLHNSFIFPVSFLVYFPVALLSLSLTDGWPCSFTYYSRYFAILIENIPLLCGILSMYCVYSSKLLIQFLFLRSISIFTNAIKFNSPKVVPINIVHTTHHQNISCKYKTNGCLENEEKTKSEKENRCDI